MFYICVCEYEMCEEVDIGERFVGVDWRYEDDFFNRRVGGFYSCYGVLNIVCEKVWVEVGGMRCCEGVVVDMVGGYCE